MENWAGELIAKAPSRAGVGAPVYKAPMALRPTAAGLQTAGTMAGSEAVQRATALIEQRLAQEEENEVRARLWGPRGFEEIQLYCQGKE